MMSNDLYKIDSTAEVRDKTQKMMTYAKWFEEINSSLRSLRSAIENYWPVTDDTEIRASLMRKIDAMDTMTGPNSSEIMKNLSGILNEMCDAIDSTLSKSVSE